MVFHSPDRMNASVPARSPRRAGRRRRARVPAADWLLTALFMLLASLVATLPAHAQDVDVARAEAPSPAATDPSVPPADLRDLDAWIEHRARAHVSVLADEARVFHRRGLLAWRSGQESEAIRLVRGAATLDPTYAAPHATLAGWYLTREPSEALQQAAALLQILNRDFLLQLAVAGNAAFLAAQTLFYALLGLGLLLILIHNAWLRHMWHERLERVVSPVSARTWAWAFLALPFVAGFGLALPALLLLGLLWPVLHARERVVVVLLALTTAAAPFAGHVTARIALPLQAEQPPFYGVATLENEPATTARQADLAERAAAHPDNGYLAFGLAWVARRNGDLAGAEAAYRSVLERWPGNDRALNNLANVLAMQGRFDESLDLYRRAMAAGPANAAPWFNASQVHTRRFEFREASELVSRAAALDFELVKTYQDASIAGELPLADQWLAPRTFWTTLLARETAGPAHPVLPPAWRGMIEASGWPVAAATLLLTVLAIVLGLVWHRRLPLRACSNCGQVLCRRCSERRRELALCRGCAAAAARAESNDFSDALLYQRRRATRRVARSVRTALATLLPGYGALAFGAVGAALVLALPAAFLFARAIGVRGPFASAHELGTVALAGGVTGTVLPWLVLYGLSILGFILRQARIDAQESVVPVRSRAAQVTHMTSKAA